MGMKDMLDRLKKKAEDKLRKVEDPAAQKKMSRQEAKKKAELTVKVIKLAKQGMDLSDKAAEKMDELANGAAQKAVEIIEKTAPIAEKVDGTAKAAFDGAAKAVVDGTKKAVEKAKEFKDAEDKKPSTGSGIFDFLTPAIPETDTTKPKAKEEKPKPPTL